MLLYLFMVGKLKECKSIVVYGIYIVKFEGKLGIYWVIVDVEVCN